MTSGTTETTDQHRGMPVHPVADLFPMLPDVAGRTAMTDQLRVNGNLVDSLGHAARHGGSALGTVPGLLRRVLETQAWREFVTQRDDHVHYDRFVDFVTTKPLKGLGATMDLIRRVVADDPVTLDLLDKATQRPPGGDHRSENVPIKTSNTHLDPAPATGTRQQALRRLRKDAPELHAKVLAKEMSAHAAMVKAGYRHPTATIPLDHAESIARVLTRKLDPEILADVSRLLKLALEDK